MKDGYEKILTILLTATAVICFYFFEKYVSRIDYQLTQLQSELDEVKDKC